uniref:Uncharacterized protein n=1 Tax=Odontella aurita TaxID=265563 RepID=A0A7S4N1E4_9STRA|mmetsp:Transcript_43831/g.133443  ORF Transcript_43831/g.133443 Transcript_43831/m.133443 type:complete len:1132 (+) Transcript_43831:140-3535(+)
MAKKRRGGKSSSAAPAAAGARVVAPPSTTAAFKGGPLCRPGLPPVITPPVSVYSAAAAASTPPQRFVLLPRTERSVEVLSALNGAAVCDLVLGNEIEESEGSDGAEATIESLCVVEVAPFDDDERKADGDDDDEDSDDDDDASEASSDSDGSDSGSDSEDEENDDEEEREARREYVVLAGLSDGSVVEWSLRSILTEGGSSPNLPLGGRRCVTPRRTSSPLSSVLGEHLSGAVRFIVASPIVAGAAYALVESVGSGTADEEEGKAAAMCLVRIEGLGGRDGGGEEDLDEVLAVVELAELDMGNSSKATKQRVLFDLLATRRGENQVIVIAADPSGLTLLLDDGGDCTRKEIVETRYPNVRMSAPPVPFALTSCAVPPRAGEDGSGDEVALGYSDGVLEVHMHVLSLAALGKLGGKGKTGGTAPGGRGGGAVVRSAHWHAHAISALCYQPSLRGRVFGADELLSGGEESVLLSWDLSRGKGDKPLQKKPRLARGGIAHICAAPASDEEGGGTDLLIHCHDDTLQLLRGHDFQGKWRVQGLAALPCEPSADRLASSVEGGVSPVLSVCPRTNLPLLASLPGSPGRVHWYDPHSGRVAGTLEVAPYNRVSRSAARDRALSAPRVSHLAASGNGDDLITIDEVSVEMGGGGGNAAKVTAIKFWSWSPSTIATVRRTREMYVPYKLVSAMPNPHGYGNRVIALAVSDDGKRAATLSPDEDGGGSLRIWGRRRKASSASAPGAGSGGQRRQQEIRPVPLWRCLRKISSPSGLSNALLLSASSSSSRTSAGGDGGGGRGRLLAFSPDGSVVAAAYGGIVALWDHENASLLATLGGGGSGENYGDDDVVRGVEFVRDGTDRVLTWGEGGVSVRTAFGDCSGGGGGGSPCWSYDVGADAPRKKKKDDGGPSSDAARVEAAAVLPGGREVAVAIRTAGGKAAATKMTLIDSASGLPVIAPSSSGEGGGAVPRLWSVDGTIGALCPAAPVSGGAGTSAKGSGDVLALTRQGEMVRLGVGATVGGAASVEAPGHVGTTASEASMRSAPRLEAVAVAAAKAGERRKRRRGDDNDLDVEQEGGGGGKAAVAYGNLFTSLGGGWGESDGKGAPPPPSADLPPLGGDVVRALVGRGLRRQRRRVGKE